MALNISPDAEAAVRARAAFLGVDPGEYADSALITFVAQDVEQEEQFRKYLDDNPEAAEHLHDALTRTAMTVDDEVTPAPAKRRKPR